MILSDQQLNTLAVVGRASSALSILGVATIIITFSFSKNFRNPMHRLIFINAFYNLFDFIATMISVSGPNAGDESALCRFQAFSLQMFPLADVFWTLAMAYDVFLIVFYHYDAEDLRRLEFKFITIITALVFIPALIFLFIRTPAKGPMYGSETIWCSISPQWVVFRILFYYGPVWLLIAFAMILYCLVGIRVFKLRQNLNIGRADHIQLSSKTSIENHSNTKTSSTLQDDEISIHTTSEHTIESPKSPITPPPTSRIHPRPNHHQSGVSFRHYVLMPLIFFLVMLSTWVAPTINRVQAFIRHDQTSYPLLVAVVATGSLRGFWNGIIFITIGMKGRRRSGRLANHITSIT
ncbi:hypothetical protein BGW36DRAFT_416662 [Talaromyces proteolyticus]|uniref:G-protein coupled receptors family 2 profile 2 domain-containing protein n=1 Tax=Talaromyces proteolyticus TaxID=1131652 RepID=A0AAD4KQH1_9EURO|nr:uncharacterized protein BGW36DRAFT_416662 [Talaromyces proteolyticus]KAH8697076.1 hypothetical protein BGW36DRAFT_416662 [Talaromyces proteolyticus]